MRPFVGRDMEVERMLSVLEGLHSGAVLTIEGEPGIGKSRLLAELAAAADERRFLVLEGRGNEGEVDVPFGPFLDALDDYLGSVNPRTIQPSDPDGRDELARIFPSLSGLGDPRAAAVQEERYRSHRAVRTMLEGLAGRKPLLLVIDDAHWADSGSIELLSHMVRHPPRAPLVLAIGMRPAQAPERLRAELRTAVRIELELRSLMSRPGSCSTIWAARTPPASFFVAAAATRSTSSSWRAIGRRLVGWAR